MCQTVFITDTKKNNNTKTQDSNHIIRTRKPKNKTLYKFIASSSKKGDFSKIVPDILMTINRSLHAKYVQNLYDVIKN